MGGYIYLIEAVRTGYYKIGITEDISERLKSLQTACPFRLRLVHAIYSDVYKYVEKYLHKRYKDFRCMGEWFAMPHDVVRDVITIMSLPVECDDLEDFDSNSYLSINKNGLIRRVKQKCNTTNPETYMPEGMSLQRLKDEVLTARRNGQSWKTKLIQKHWGVEGGRIYQASCQLIEMALEYDSDDQELEHECETPDAEMISFSKLNGKPDLVLVPNYTAPSADLLPEGLSWQQFQTEVQAASQSRQNWKTKLIEKYWGASGRRKYQAARQLIDSAMGGVA